MSDVRVIRVKSKLASLAFRQGGLMAREAIARADKAIDDQSPTLLVFLDKSLAELESRFGETSCDGSVGDYEGLYALASQIIDTSLGLRGSLIDEAAHALCSLADLASELGKWDRQAVEIHIMVLRLLRFGGVAMSLPRRRKLVDGLYKVTEKRLGQASPLAG